ncbi:hypothetical protein [Brevundimonas sp.]|uniref:hypothetical protein n=1 Tax=Brevundimonas sp. TaxID=1871086 RepID=UPI00286BB7D7|nr:hypothetical protein [Brevundimonas sp.]
MTDLYRIRPADVWVQARDDYLSGLSAETVCRRHDLGLSAFRRRARKFGWRRSDQVEPDLCATDLSLYDDIQLEEQIQTARLRFVQALEIGKAIEASRWRRLWLDLREAADILHTEFYAGMSSEEIADSRGADTSDETEDEAMLLGPPASSTALLSAPPAPALQAPGMYTNLHPEKLPAPDPVGTDPSAISARPGP